VVAAIELIHTALVHDDVVDDSNWRRGFFSINALWKIKLQCLEIIYQKDYYFLSITVILSLKISVAVREMSEGDTQIEKPQT
jgi:octaprenyl-diphosphate synthase